MSPYRDSLPDDATRARYEAMQDAARQRQRRTAKAA